MKSKYTKEILQPIVAESRSIRQVIIKLGLDYSGGNHAHIKRIIEYHELDTSHFTGQASNKGISYTKLTPQDYLINDETNFRHTYKIKNLILRDNIKPHQCEKCLFTEWNGLPIPLELHHKDGNKRNNLIENLELLCPNCHAQTKNYRGKAKKLILL